MAERKEFIGRLIVAGPTRTMTGEANGYVVEAEAIRRAVAEGLFRGLACFADHAAGGESPAVRRLVGVWHDVVYDEAARRRWGGCGPMTRPRRGRWWWSCWSNGWETKWKANRTRRPGLTWG